MKSFCSWDGITLTLNVLGNPSSKKTCIGKVKGNQLKVSVNAQPVNGQATDYLVQYLAKEFCVKIKDITVVYGHTQINKQLKILAPKKLPKIISDELERQQNQSTKKA
jgi:hypothetical protein